MRNIIVVAASFALASCASFSMPDMFKTTPPTATVQLESQPPGAEAKTSTGQTCKTPCSLAVQSETGFSVTFTLPKYQPETIPVQLVKQSTDSNGNTAVSDPNPVYAELKPAGPLKRGKAAAGAKVAAAPKAKKPKAAASPADDDSPFPAPPR